ncbi:hypothetical protein Enr13x_66400 [Stieleria neptunia]|uniref:Formylglycine-generating sulfatase enzyme n=1 Tax=Stieleria neptunia TaxID=2527979 RepID=A0A518I0X5_9BACT|nr:hypothetical protein [Stieleria neptunia]QDV46731.1 hypothetical protein Enr13x_66400 [Stieleria neptunia]
MKMPAKLLLIALLLLGCSRPTDVDSARELSTMVTNQWGMEFVLIPASGEGWEAHCESHDIHFQPISSFYMQRSELSRLEFAAVFPDNLRVNLRKDLHPSQTIPSWIDAVRLVHSMSSDDPSFAYRLPTVAEWRYTYYLLRRRRSTELAEDIEGMTGENWEFAVKTKMPTPEGARNRHDPSFHEESFVLTGSPPDYEHSTFRHYASPTPPTGDDGIDEYTGVRLVLVPDSADNS